MLVEKGREMATLVEEREENREILASREKEKLVHSMAGARMLETESFLFQVKKVKKELKAKFLRSHQILQQREAALMSELDQLVANYKGEAIREQIRDLNQMKETLKSSVQRKENQEIAVKSLEPMNNRIRELEIRLETVFGEMRGVELKWDRKLEERLSKLGEINVITAQALEEFSGSLNYYDTRIYDLRSREKYFRNYRDKTRTVSFPHPHYYCSTCMEKNGLKIQCGHFICPDCLLDLVWYQILNIKPGFFCPACPHILSIEDIIKFGLPTEEEKQFIMTALSMNFCESQDIVQCPNCSSYCQRMNSECPRMECTVCAIKGKKNTFCWYCLREWKKVSKYQDSCGNANCRRKDFEALRNCPKENRKRYAGELITIPTLRACPHCFTIVEYVKGSYHVDCRNCSKIFCFICLEKEIDGAMLCISYKKITCWTAPVQIKLRL